MDPLGFEVEQVDRQGRARIGQLHTPHGTLETPAFLPVGTHGAVRGLAVAELRAVGVQGLLANTYHLHLRPGETLVRALGGLHSFMGWQGPILTDSGGFQLHSLAHLSKRDERGVRFRSPIDGSARELTPESCIRIQEELGADLIASLDEFEPVPADSASEDPAHTRVLLERSLRWAERCQLARTRGDQLLFGIIQGGGIEELRAESAARTAALGFEAFAIGGLGLGESTDRRATLAAAAIAPLPGSAVRYLMGLGLPGDLVDGIALGVDLFDCVVPTRHGRHGIAFTTDGPLALRNARFREDPAPLEAGCPCAACANHSRAYLRHLQASGEVLGARLLSLHNIAYYMRLLSEVRTVIREQRFGEWRESWWRRYSDGRGGTSAGTSDATHSAA